MSRTEANLDTLPVLKVYVYIGIFSDSDNQRAHYKEVTQCKPRLLC